MARKCKVHTVSVQAEPPRTQQYCSLLQIL